MAIIAYILAHLYLLSLGVVQFEGSIYLKASFLHALKSLREIVSNFDLLYEK